MVDNERRISLTKPDNQQIEFDVPSLAASLQAAPQERLDRHLGRGIGFTLGGQTSLELYPHIVRVSLPAGQVVVPRTEAEVCPEGVVFQDKERFLLSVGPQGDVLFQYSPPSPALRNESIREGEVTDTAPSLPDVLEEVTPEPVALPSPTPPPARSERKEKSEKYVGRLGEIKTHWTKAGKFVAEVEVMVPDPDNPAASRLVKFAAFNRMAEALQQSYQPGQLVTAVGIPHELKRTNRDGKQWTERQLYFVQLPKSRERR